MSTFIVNNFLYPNIEDYNRLLIKKLNKNSIDLIVLAGYMKLLPLEIVKAYHNRILNIHPALLPKFGGKGYYGNRVHEAVIASGDLESGVTVHFVTEVLDDGPNIIQAVIPVSAEDDADSLRQKVQKQEHIIYPIAVKWFIEGRLKMDKGKAWLDNALLPDSGLQLEA